MLGTIMRPVTDMVRISRAKLAYILDSMGCNLAALSPISSYGLYHGTDCRRAVGKRR